MIKIKSTIALLTLSALFLTSCGDDDIPKTDATINDATLDARDTAVDSTMNDATTKNKVENDFGFTINAPQTRELECGKLGSQEIKDENWICTFDYDGKSGFLHVENSAVSCSDEIFRAVTYGNSRGEARIEGAHILTDVSYDEGGNHLNDSFSFSLFGKYFTFNHSSFGFGFRKCQPMDCIQVYASKNGALEEDGCTTDRTLPIVCLKVDANESYEAADFVDMFEKCPGDPNLE